MSSYLYASGIGGRRSGDNGQPGFRLPTSNRTQLLAQAATASRRYALRGYFDRAIAVKGIAFTLTILSATDDAVDVGLYNSAGTWITSSGATTGKVNAGLGRKEVLFPTPVACGIGVYYAAFAYGASAAPATLMFGSFASAYALQIYGGGFPLTEGDATAGATLPTTTWGAIGFATGSLPELIVVEA